MERLLEEYENPPFNLMPEYGSWMLEMIPSSPYSTKGNFQEVIDSIKLRYDFLHSTSRIALTIPSIPFLGVREKGEKFLNEITQS